MKYFGSFADRDDVLSNFATTGAEFPTEEQILFASYDTPDYEGAAVVVFERDGTLYEVNGSHCSCSGLEGQWIPEETTWAALAMRGIAYTHPEAEQFLANLAAQRQAPALAT